MTFWPVVPEVWRRLLVPGQIDLAKAHQIFQTALGWTDSHLHCFGVGELTYGTRYEDYRPEDLDETTVTLAESVAGHSRFSYEYDFGDSLDQEVVIKETSRTRLGLKFAVCIDRANACPPEDCGLAAISLMLEALGDPDHEPGRNNDPGVRQEQTGRGMWSLLLLIGVYLLQSVIRARKV